LPSRPNGRSIETVESLAGADRELDELQRAFREHHALQCGFCTPAMLLTATEFLRENPDETEEMAIRETINGLTCRRTGYQQVITQKVGRARECRLGPAQLQDAARWINQYRRAWAGPARQIRDLRRTDQDATTMSQDLEVARLIDAPLKRSSTPSPIPRARRRCTVKTTPAGSSAGM
jgi:xanthine dehydrogenase iron-sulfur cluster and FAD-binding subunit A